MGYERLKLTHLYPLHSVRKVRRKEQVILMESILKIRRWVLADGRSIRSVARQTGLSRNTIKKYLKDGSPPSYHRQAGPMRHKLCNGFDTRLEELFEQDQKRPRRERPLSSMSSSWPKATLARIRRFRGIFAT